MTRGFTRGELSYRLWHYGTCVGCGAERRFKHLHKLPYTLDGRQVWGWFRDKCVAERMKGAGE